MILQEGRVAAAACFLPLTVNPRVSRELGTRHRAAIGLTEECDAVAVVVSEETGSISLALDGRIERGLSGDRAAGAAPVAGAAAPLRAQRNVGAQVIRRLMAYHPFRNLGLKLMAVLLASALWFTVAGEQNVERTMRVPLEFRNKPALTSEIVGDAADDGRRPRAGILGAAQPDRSGRSRRGAGPGRPPATGSRLFQHADRRMSGCPYGVDVLQVTPSTISLELEESAQADAEGRTRRSRGSRRPDSSPARSTSDPAEVEVIGPESHVKRLTSATTEPVSSPAARAAVDDR